MPSGPFQATPTEGGGPSQKRGLAFASACRGRRASASSDRSPSTAPDRIAAVDDDRRKAQRARDHGDLRRDDRCRERPLREFRREHGLGPPRRQRIVAGEKQSTARVRPAGSARGACRFVRRASPEPPRLATRPATVSAVAPSLKLPERRAARVVGPAKAASGTSSRLPSATTEARLPCRVMASVPCRRPPFSVASRLRTVRPSGVATALKVALSARMPRPRSSCLTRNAASPPATSRVAARPRRRPDRARLRVGACVEGERRGEPRQREAVEIDGSGLRPHANERRAAHRDFRRRPCRRRAGASRRSRVRGRRGRRPEPAPTRSRRPRAAPGIDRYRR